jgi:hypothetical protein
MAALTVLTPDDSEVTTLFPEDEDAKGLGPLPPGIQARLEELGERIERDTTITLFRDWEGNAFGLSDPEGDPRFDVLAFTDDGRVGYGGVNQPAYFDTVAEWCDAEEAARR